MEAASDFELILHLQTGSLEALGALYDRHQHMVYRTALAITGDPDAAADLLQDTFLRLHRFASHIDTARPLEPWLYRITANLAYTWVKRGQRWLRPLEDVAEWLAGGKKAASPRYGEPDDTWGHVQQAVLSLPISHRIVVVLYYVNDLSLQEIAEALEIPVGTVKSRLYYGRQALKSSLEGLQGNRLLEMIYEFT